MADFILSNVHSYTAPSIAGFRALIIDIETGIMTDFIVTPDAFAQYLLDLSIQISDIYLTQDTAATLYLTQTNAAANYAPIATAGNPYLTQTNAAANYAPIAQADNPYLTQIDASANYINTSIFNSVNGYVSAQITQLTNQITQLTNQSNQLQTQIDHLNCLNSNPLDTSICLI